MSLFQNYVALELDVKFKKLHEDAVLPYYATDGSAGLDCHTVTDPIIEARYVCYKLGIAMEIPKNYVGLLFPRSSVSKKDLMLANAVGVVDFDFRGEVQARFKQINPELKSNQYKKGDAVCQLIILPYPKIKPQWADELSDTVRGEGGFGSTDS